MSDTTCCYCGQTFAAPDLRPYGPGGAMTCFPCATDPEREATTKAQFDATVDLMADASPFGIVVLDEHGLSPLMTPPDEISPPPAA